MIIKDSGIFLYFLMSFGSGYAVGSFRNIGFLHSWLLSIIFVPIAYELLNPNFLMIITVIGFSLGLFFAKSVSFFDVIGYLNPSRFLQRRTKSTFQGNAKHQQPKFSKYGHDTFENLADGRKPEEILGLSPDFTQAELKTAYQKESNRTHPDKWVNKPDSIKQVMEFEQKLINMAYKKLKK
ncbi:MAG: DnaJ domain-containing protein [Methylococcales bacterium]|jgi:DnaJ domain|nr:DnaJ domain-containing protein [Methylococcales bacterium]